MSRKSETSKFSTVRISEPENVSEPKRRRRRRRRGGKTNGGQGEVEQKNDDEEATEAAKVLEPHRDEGPSEPGEAPHNKLGKTGDKLNESEVCTEKGQEDLIFPGMDMVIEPCPECSTVACTAGRLKLRQILAANRAKDPNRIFLPCRERYLNYLGDWKEAFLELRRLFFPRIGAVSAKRKTPKGEIYTLQVCYCGEPPEHAPTLVKGKPVVYKEGYLVDSRDDGMSITSPIASVGSQVDVLLSSMIDQSLARGVLPPQPKCFKAGGAPLTAVEESVQKTLDEVIADSINSEIGSQIRSLSIVSAEEVKGVREDAKIVLVWVHCNLHKKVQELQPFLIREFKRLAATHVFFVAKRTILGTQYAMRARKPHLQSHTRIFVRDAMLEDVVYPFRISGKRTLVSSGAKSLQVSLHSAGDSSSSSYLEAEQRLRGFACVFKKIAGWNASFKFDRP